MRKGVSIGFPSAALEPLINDVLDVESQERSWLRDVELKQVTDSSSWTVCYQGKGSPVYLRWSKGPVQGFFWDVYPDVFDRLGWAVRALVTAPSPVYAPPKVSK